MSSPCSNNSPDTPQQQTFTHIPGAAGVDGGHIVGENVKMSVINNNNDSGSGNGNHSHSESIQSSHISTIGNALRNQLQSRHKCNVRMSQGRRFINGMS